MDKQKVNQTGSTPSESTPETSPVLQPKPISTVPVPGEEPFPRPAKKKRRHRRKKKEDRRKIAALHELKRNIAILLTVAAAASIIGWLAITRCQFGGIFDRPDQFGSIRQTASDEIIRLTAQLPDASISCLTTGEANQFFIAEGETISRCRAEYQDQQLTVTRLWTRKFEKKVTALYYVRGKTPLTGLLLAAMGNRIETVNPEQNEGGGSLFAELEPESNIVSLTSDFVSVFAADASKRHIVRFTMLGEQNLTLGDAAAEGGPENTADNNTDNTAEDTSPQEEVPGPEKQFSGFDLGTLGIFSIDYSPADKMLYASNPGQFRVEVFDPVSGAWKQEASWGKNAHDRGGFYPEANPVSLTVFPEGNIATVENGPKPRIRFFHSDGTSFSVLDDPILDSDQKAPPFIQMGPSQQRLGQIYLLTPDGKLAFFTISDFTNPTSVPEP